MSSLTSVESRDDVLLRSLKRYYASPASLRVLTDVLKNKTKVSLRTLDWLCTNYAKKTNTVYIHNNKTVNIFLEYKGCLKAFSKRCFDPFQRRDRITITDADGQPMQSTIGQLNFFRFAISLGIVAYATKNAARIEEDMLRAIRHRVTKTPHGPHGPHGPQGPQGPHATKTKRKELSKAAIKTATATDIKVVVRFS